MCFVVAALAAFSAPAHAADADLDALSIADTAPAPVAAARDWRAFVEAGYGGANLRPTGNEQYTRRLSADLQIDHALAPDWRLIAADRLDIQSPADRAQVNSGNSINTLKEAYLGWRPRDDAMLDLGRINVRNGVAMGYSPTDYFRVNALRTIVSVDPASLKQNRLGSVMSRGQWLWDNGSVSALFSPKLAAHASQDGFNPDWGATNARDRALVMFSPRLGEQLTPQLLLYQEAGRDAQLGLNLTALFSDAAVGYLEWSGGRSASSLTQALRQAGVPHADDTTFRNHVATGLTYTTSDKLSVTLEYQYNGSSLDAGDWYALRATPIVYGIYRQALRATLDSPSREAAFLYAAWQDAMINHLDLNAMHRRNSADGSSMSWLEARYHWDNMEAALQWQMNAGEPWSEFGATPQRRVWQLLCRRYL